MPRTDGTDRAERQVVSNIKNNSGRKLEWKSWKAWWWVDEKKTSPPDLSDKMTVTLLPGEYEMTLRSLAIRAQAGVVTDSAALKTPPTKRIWKIRPKLLADYKVSRSRRARAGGETKILTEAVKAGDIEKANSFADTASITNASNRLPSFSWTRPRHRCAWIFDFKDGAKDAGFTYFHRGIEYALGKRRPRSEIAAKLMTDVEALQKEIDALAFPPARCRRRIRIRLKKWRQ